MSASGTTPVAGWPLPEINDTTPVVSDLYTWVDYADVTIYPRFDTVSDRDTAIPSPTAGMVAYCADTKEYYKYGTAWTSWMPRIFHLTSPVTLSGTSNSDLFVITLEASSTYAFYIIYNIDSNGTSDAFDTSWSFSSAISSGLWRLGLNNVSPGGQTTESVSTEKGIGFTAQDLIDGTQGCYIITSAATTATIRGRKNSNGAGNTTIVRPGSFVEVWKIG